MAICFGRPMLALFTLAVFGFGCHNSFGAVIPEHERGSAFTQAVRRLEQLQHAYPVQSTILNYGVSFEGRPLLAFKIDCNPHDVEAKNAGISALSGSTMVQASFKANQFTTVLGAFCLIEQMLRSCNKSGSAASLYVFPLPNPDGFEFAIGQHATAAAAAATWTKSRSRPTKCSNIECCLGVDLSGNFAATTPDSLARSTAYCAEDYAGVEQFSEPESRSLADFLVRNNQSIAAYAILHERLPGETLEFDASLDTPIVWARSHLAVDGRRSKIIEIEALPNPKTFESLIGAKEDRPSQSFPSACAYFAKPLSELLDGFPK